MRRDTLVEIHSNNKQTIDLDKERNLILFQRPKVPIFNYLILSYADEE